MASKTTFGLLILALAAGIMLPLLVVGPALAVGRAGPTPTPTPLPIPPAKVGSNANLAIGALLLVVIILFGVVLNIKRKK